MRQVAMSRTRTPRSTSGRSRVPKMPGMPAFTENSFMFSIKNFFEGIAPLAHLDAVTEQGGIGQASVFTNCDVISVPGYVTQGPGLSNLTNGTQTGAVTELIGYILDKAVAANVTYGIGNTILQKISATTVTNTGGTFPYTITGASGGGGNSLALLKGNLYYFFNKVSGGDIGKYDLALTFDDDWGSTDPASGAAAIQNAPHPVAVEQDTMVFGNGQYVGTYISSTDTLNVSLLNFGNDCQVVDVIFHGNLWYIAVNSGVAGTNKNDSRVYLWEAAAISTFLTDETSVGAHKIGFLYPLNGRIYIAYQDLTDTNGYKVGYISGRSIKPLAYFSGSLPTFAQKTAYKDTLLYLANGAAWSCGAPVETLPVQSSQLASGGYATVGAIAAPFGTPMIASTDGGTNFRLAQFSGFDTSSRWKSIVYNLTKGRLVGYVDYIIVRTKTLVGAARCDLTIEGNQGVNVGTVQQILAGSRRHVYNSIGLGKIEDVRIALTWANGDTTNDCAIKEIIVMGHYAEL